MHFPFISLFVVPTILFSTANSDVENANINSALAPRDNIIDFIETIWAPERMEDEGMDVPFLGGGTETREKTTLEKKHHRIKRGGIGSGTLQMTKQFTPVIQKSSPNFSRGGNFKKGANSAVKHNLAMPRDQPVGLVPLKIRSQLKNNAPENSFSKMNGGNYLKFGNNHNGKNWNKIGGKNIWNKYNAGQGWNGAGNGGMNGVKCHHPSGTTLANVAAKNGAAAELADWSRRHLLNQMASIGLQIGGWKYPGDWANMAGEIMERNAKEELDDPNAIFIELAPNFSLANVQKIRSIASVMQGVLECPVNVIRHRQDGGSGKGGGAAVKRHLFHLNVVNGAAWHIPNPVGFLLPHPKTSEKASTRTVAIEGKGAANLDDIELGQLLIRAICGGGQRDCDTDMNAPEYGVKQWSIKPKPKSDELDRALRPMLLKLSAKLKRGRLWVDNPVGGYRNYYQVAVVFDQNIDGKQLAALRGNLGHIQRNSPFQFVRGQFSKPRHKLKFVVHHGESKAPNGLQREEEEQIVYINEKELEKNSDPVKRLIMKALGIDAGARLRTNFDRRDNYICGMRSEIARLNVAYGAENFAINGPIDRIFSEDGLYEIDKPETQFWTEYPNMEEGKYEIPIVYDESFKELAEQHKSMLKEIYENFEKNSVVKFVLHEEPPKGKFYTRVYGDKNPDCAQGSIGHRQEMDADYNGQSLRFGRNQMERVTVYHEMLHIAGLAHEHQRADAGEHLSIARAQIEERLAGFQLDGPAAFATNFPFKNTYLPKHVYNPESIMHYKIDYFATIKNVEKNGDEFKRLMELDRNVEREPHKWDWENLNHFYGVGSGKQRFEVDGKGQIVDEFLRDGERRLRK